MFCLRHAFWHALNKTFQTDAMVTHKKRETLWNVNLLLVLFLQLFTP